MEAISYTNVTKTSWKSIKTWSLYLNWTDALVSSTWHTVFTNCWNKNNINMKPHVFTTTLKSSSKIENSRKMKVFFILLIPIQLKAEIRGVLFFSTRARVKSWKFTHLFYSFPFEGTWAGDRTGICFSAFATLRSFFHECTCTRAYCKCSFWRSLCSPRRIWCRNASRSLGRRRSSSFSLLCRRL